MGLNINLQSMTIEEVRSFLLRSFLPHTPRSGDPLDPRYHDHGYNTTAMRSYSALMGTRHHTWSIPGIPGCVKRSYFNRGRDIPMDRLQVDVVDGVHHRCLPSERSSAASSPQWWDAVWSASATRPPRKRVHSGWRACCVVRGRRRARSRPGMARGSTRTATLWPACTPWCLRPPPSRRLPFLPPCAWLRIQHAHRNLYLIFYRGRTGIDL